jgi:hypothetical protein
MVFLISTDETLLICSSWGTFVTFWGSFLSPRKSIHVGPCWPVRMPSAQLLVTASSKLLQPHNMHMLPSACGHACVIYPASISYMLGPRPSSGIEASYKQPFQSMCRESLHIPPPLPPPPTRARARPRPFVSLPRNSCLMHPALPPAISGSFSCCERKILGEAAGWDNSLPPWLLLRS